LPKRLGEALSAAQHQLKMTGGAAAGVGHIDVGIGAVGDQRVGMLDHVRRDIGMQVEADHQRQLLADHLTHALEDFAFAVVEMLGHHGAVQIEINGIERSGGPDAVDHHRDDALERILGHMGRGTGSTEDGRHQLPAVVFCLLDKARQPDIDVAYGAQHIRSLHHRRPAAAMHEIGIERLRRREGVGLVQEAANGDTGH